MKLIGNVLYIEDETTCSVKFDFGNTSKANVSDIDTPGGITKCSSTLSGFWKGIVKTQGTFFVEVNSLDNSIQPALRCRGTNNCDKWNNTHSYAENNTFYSAIVLENLQKRKGNFKVRCTKRNGKSKKS